MISSREFRNDVLLGAAMAALIAFVIAVATYQPPETDAGPAGAPVGLVATTDALTGCQYLRARGHGNLTPRRDGQGKHIGCRP